MSQTRPFGVTLVAIIAWITGLIQIISGVVAIFADSLAVGATTIAIGVITILVSLGLFRGSNGARIVVTIVFLINIAASIYFTVGMQGSIWTAIGATIFPVIGLILLYTSRANAYFRS